MTLWYERMTHILKTPNVPVARAWNTWAADRYLEMSFRPLGVRVTPMLFSAKASKADFVGPGSDIRLGAHAADGSAVSAEITNAGTVLDWQWQKPSPYDLEGGWSTKTHGEWGLRFWVVLCLSSDEGGSWHYDPATGTASLTLGPRTVALKAGRAPLLVTGHASVAAVAEEYEKHGYWYLASRATDAPVLALRFNLEEAPTNRFTIAIRDRADLAIAAAAIVPQKVPPETPTGPQASLTAVRDIMGWNTIWDSVNHRPYITCSRNWDLKKFGGFGFWLNDTAVNAMLVSLFDPDQGRETLSALLYGATPAGNLPCLLTGNDAWVDRTQNPLVAFITWQIFLRTRNLPLLQTAYPVLARNHAWLMSARDGNGNGLIEYGSSDVGEGLYIGTKLAAKDESFMDNSPMHDEASWMPASRTLDCEDVGLNSLAALDSETLGLMAAELGFEDAATKHRQDAEVLARKISSDLWDGTRKTFANRLWSGRFVKSVTPTSFFPLLCGAASKDQIAAMVRQLDDDTAFGGTFGLPSVRRDDPAINDNVYWRGRIWPILNWLTWLGLSRVGEFAAAEKLAEKSKTLFEKSWAQQCLAPENYNPKTGEGLDQGDTDPFYSWTALLPYIQLASVAEISPWHGLVLHPSGPDAELGPLALPFGMATIKRRQGTLSVSRAGNTLFELSLAGPARQVEWTRSLMRFTVPAGSTGNDWVRFPATAGAVLTALQDGTPLKPIASSDGILVKLQPAKAERRITILFEGKSVGLEKLGTASPDRTGDL